MQFLYRIRPTRLGMLTDGPTDDERRIVGEHFEYLQRLLAQGVLLMAGRTTNDDATTFGLCILNADDEAQARERMRDDPAVQHGVMTAELFPYRVALWSARGPLESD